MDIGGFSSWKGLLNMGIAAQGGLESASLEVSQEHSELWGSVTAWTLTLEVFSNLNDFGIEECLGTAWLRPRQ